MNFRVIKISLTSFVAVSMALQAKGDPSAAEANVTVQTHDECNVILKDAPGDDNHVEPAKSDAPVAKELGKEESQSSGSVLSDDKCSLPLGQFMTVRCQN